MSNRLKLYGKNTMNFGCDPNQPIANFGDRHQMSHKWNKTVGGHIHIGYVGWRKWWDKLKKFFKLPECSCSFGIDYDCPQHSWNSVKLHGWRRYWSIFKKCYIFGWPKFFKECYLWASDNWVYFVVIFIIITAVDILSKWAGILSVYIW